MRTFRMNGYLRVLVLLVAVLGWAPAAQYTEYSQNEQVLLDNVWGNAQVREWLFAQSRASGTPGSRK